MNINESYLRTHISKAIKEFWLTRIEQKDKQGRETGQKDKGNRSAVTGGAQMDGFIKLISNVLEANGVARTNIYSKETTLPGYFRPTKEWDLVVTINGELLASIEFKSQVGSFGNNFNNRIEEALGSATDIWTAYSEGAFRASQKPWLGWFMLLEDVPKSNKPVRVHKAHFDVLEEFQGTSYAQRYEIFCEKLLRERLYDACCLILSNQEIGINGLYREPNNDLTFLNFIRSLVLKALTFSA